MHMVDINCVRNNKWRTHHVIQVNDRFEFKKIYAVRIQFTLKKNKQTHQDPRPEETAIIRLSCFETNV